MVKTWTVEFIHGRGSLKDNRSQRRPVIITTQETIVKIHDNIMTDRRVSKYYIATEFGISQDRIHAVIHNELHMSKVSACCVPKLLGPDSKRTRLNMSKENHVICRQNCDYGSDLGRSLQTRDKATIETVEIPRFSAS